MNTTNRKNGIGFDGPADIDEYREMWDAYKLWKENDSVVAYDACTIVVDEDDEDEIYESCRDCGINLSNRRPVYYVSGPEGFVVHEIK